MKLKLFVLSLSVVFASTAYAERETTVEIQQSMPDQNAWQQESQAMQSSSQMMRQEKFVEDDQQNGEQQNVAQQQQQNDEPQNLAQQQQNGEQQNQNQDQQQQNNEPQNQSMTQQNSKQMTQNNKLVDEQNGPPQDYADNNDPRQNLPLQNPAENVGTSPEIAQQKDAQDNNDAQQNQNIEQSMSAENQQLADNEFGQPDTNRIVDEGGTLTIGGSAVGNAAGAKGGQKDSLLSTRNAENKDRFYRSTQHAPQRNSGAAAGGADTTQPPIPGQ